MQTTSHQTCSRCGAEAGTTIKRLRDKIYTPVSDTEFDQFVEYIRRNKTTGEKARQLFKYELVAVLAAGEQIFCTHCIKYHKADLMRNRNNVAKDNSGNGILPIFNTFQ